MVDASDADALSGLVRGADALLNCANPRDYTVWDEVWPPLAASLLTTAERTGATLVTAASLYPYGFVRGPMTEGMPDRAADHKGRLRARMWADAKAGHDAGRLRAVEVRASDYLGAGVGQNGHVSRQVPTAAQGKGVWMIGDPDLPHTFTDVTDMGRTLAAVAFEESSWGQVWHAVSQPPSSQRAALTGALAAIGREPVAVHGIGVPLVRAIGLGEPMMRELGQLGHLRPPVRHGLQPDAGRPRARALALGRDPAPDGAGQPARGARGPRLRAGTGPVHESQADSASRLIGP